MKGAFELAIILLVGFPMILLGINFVQIMMSYNNARHLSQYVVNTIEDQNRYDENVDELILKDSNKICNSCLYTVESINDKYLVKVEFPVVVSLINYKNSSIIKTFTMPLSETKKDSGI